MSKPNWIQTVLSVAACKGTRGLLRITGRGGTALPGKTARIFAKDILEVTSSGMEIIVVTGTNGKTTTSRMLEHALTAAGRECLANKSGANLLSGVTAEVTCNATWTGRPKTHYAVIECDEGALKQVVPLIHPKVIVVTNLFRDQLDRYGEVMHTVEQIRTGIQKVPEAVLCLNADDSLVSSLAFDVPNRVVWYGLDTPVGEQKDAAVSDAKYCIRCGTPYQYHYHTYAHLGDFYCPSCGYHREKTQVAVTKIEKISAEGSLVRMHLAAGIAESGKPSDAQAAASGKTDFADFASKNATEENENDLQVRIGLPAVYNIYNAAAAVCAYTAFGLPAEEILSSLADVHSSFGRMETFEVGNNRVQMILVKNPAGCNQALAYVASLEEDFNLVFCLNDRTADGHDISWIWDADYEQVMQDLHVRHIYVSGDRAADMQLRLKYADCAEEKITMMDDNEKLLEEMRNSSLPSFILPNYTSMLALRKVLSDATGGTDFWKG